MVEESRRYGDAWKRGIDAELLVGHGLADAVQYRLGQAR